ncbi:hypothetical protein IPJ72_00195 [Candidatus Peregrinibacteria bacterium]|nr:MAG: hypothetical protein IPJ72_00195 [Candidatus Peregrinibacteria bacterium]
MTIGVFALQGSFAEHIAQLKRLGVDAFEIRSLADVKQPVDGIILPGGESTTLMLLLKSTGLDRWLKDFVKRGGFVWHVCRHDCVQSGLFEFDRCYGGTECVWVAA